MCITVNELPPGFPGPDDDGNGGLPPDFPNEDPTLAPDVQKGTGPMVLWSNCTKECDSGVAYSPEKCPTNETCVRYAVQCNQQSCNGGFINSYSYYYYCYYYK